MLGKGEEWRVGEGEGGGKEGGGEGGLAVIMFTDYCRSSPTNVSRHHVHSSIHCTYVQYSTYSTPQCIFRVPKFFLPCSATVTVPSKYLWSYYYYSLY